MEFLSVFEFSPWELFIGTPWLKRETRILESPVPVPTGTTSGPQGKLEEGSVCQTDNFSLADNRIIPIFQRKQGDKVIWNCGAKI
jgi:hypothetical protein